MATSTSPLSEALAELTERRLRVWAEEASTWIWRSLPDWRGVREGSRGSLRRGLGELGGEAGVKRVCAAKTNLSAQHDIHWTGLGLAAKA